MASTFRRIPPTLVRFPAAAPTESPLRCEGGGPFDAEPLDVLGECVGRESKALGGALGMLSRVAQPADVLGERGAPGGEGGRAAVVCGALCGGHVSASVMAEYVSQGHTCSHSAQ